MQSNQWHIWFRVVKHSAHFKSTERGLFSYKNPIVSILSYNERIILVSDAAVHVDVYTTAAKRCPNEGLLYWSMDVA